MYPEVGGQALHMCVGVEPTSNPKTYNTRHPVKCCCPFTLVMSISQDTRTHTHSARGRVSSRYRSTTRKTKTDEHIGRMDRFQRQLIDKKNGMNDNIRVTVNALSVHSNAPLMVDKRVRQLFQISVVWLALPGGCVSSLFQAQSAPAGNSLTQR